ncbi:MAG: peptidoglycan DD-metalloendopeptidase family protein [Pseudomonadales bacterium]|jgi:septal ring factor EnvC (AmiA/AmiB activator)
MPASSHAADSSSEPATLEKQLKALQFEINKFQQILDSTEDQKTDLEDNLQFNEEKINDLLNKIESIQKNLTNGEARVGRLLNQQTELQLAKSEQQQYIERQIRAAYEIGNQEYLKVILNQEDPNQLSRMLTYYDYFNRARSEQVREFSDTIEQLRRVSKLVENENSSLKDNRRNLQLEQTALKVTQSNKRKVLKAINLEIAITGKALEKKIQDRQHLERLIISIQQGIANLVTPADIVPFASLKGELILPVSGRISHRYGHRRNTGNVKWQGVVIDATEGDPVYAVHYGRVVFSDWLRGFGLLMIINHGEGHMSLYGHNQVLYRETGEWVTAGETIAAVGDSGGQNKSGLYFEIRVAGKTTDPQLWCRVRSKRAA